MNFEVTGFWTKNGKGKKNYQGKGKYSYWWITGKVDGGEEKNYDVTISKDNPNIGAIDVGAVLVCKEGMDGPGSLFVGGRASDVIPAGQEAPAPNQRSKGKGDYRKRGSSSNANQAAKRREQLGLYQSCSQATHFIVQEMASSLTAKGTEITDNVATSLVDKHFEFAMYLYDKIMQRFPDPNAPAPVPASGKKEDPLRNIGADMKPPSTDDEFEKMLEDMGV